MGATMSTYGELIRQKADETEIRRFLVDGEQGR